MYKSAEKADYVIFESQYTQNYFLKRYNISKDRTTVINIGKDNFFSSISSNIGSDFSDQKPYALCVSHLYPYKNIPRMIEAFAIVKRNTESDYKLLIAGGKRSNKYYNEITNIIKKLKLKDSVILLGSVSKEDLRYLYSSCEYLIFPSPCENFAYTLLEAMNCSAPIITTNTTAMPETCGNAALYFSPDSAQELSACIMVFLNDKKTRLKYKEMALLKSTEYEVYSVVNKKTNQLLKKLF